MKIIITGCAGFIGANFTQYWLDNYSDDVIVGVDCLTYASNLTQLKKLRKNPRLHFYKTDICDREEIYRIVKTENPDVIVNFAAESHVDNSIQTPDIFMKTNVLGTQVLLDACVKFDVKRFHQISTDEVYGDLPLDSNERFAENSPLKPSSPYSASKAAADLLVLAYFRTYGLSVTISRSTNNYGKYQHEEKLIPKIIKTAGTGMRIPIYGDGKNVRDWLHADDHCRAIDVILRKGKIGEIYNIAGNNEIDNLALAKQILRILGRNNEQIAFVEDRKGHDRRYSVSAQKMITELGWQAEMSFKKGLRETVMYYKNKKNKIPCMR